jgi:hypothetical protein
MHVISIVHIHIKDQTANIIPPNFKSFVWIACRPSSQSFGIVVGAVVVIVIVATAVFEFGSFLFPPVE